MPRDIGTGLYHYPEGTPGNPAQTIFSTRYNTFINDLTNTLNQALPVNMGGTGATNATEARDNLDAEVSMAQVTNYDTHVFEAGSFYSQSGATGAPVVGEIFLGIYYGDNVNGFVDGRSLNTGARYSRNRSSSIWGPWRELAQYSTVDLDSRFVNVTGDTMTGALNVQGDISSTAIVSAANNMTAPYILVTAQDGLRTTVAAGSHSRVLHQITGVRQWSVGCWSDSFFRITDDTGAAVLMAINPTGGHVAFHAGATISGNRFTAADTITANGSITSNTSIISAGGVVYAKASAAGAYFSMTNNASVEKGRCYWDNVSGNVVITNMTHNLVLRASGPVDLGVGFTSRPGQAGPQGNSVHNFNWVSSIQAWIDTTNVGTLAYVSDYRIKKDVADLPNTWDTVKALRPIKYTQAQYTPKKEVERRLKEAAAEKEKAKAEQRDEVQAPEVGPMFPADNIERWGFVAHELQATLTPSASSGYKDDPDTVQSPNPWTVIAALTRALQEAMARIEALEAAQATP